jgi:hypothetical protein
MKKFTHFRFVTIFMVMMIALISDPSIVVAQALEPISTIIDKTQASGNLPSIINNAGNNRGAGFNGQQIFVASRQDGNHIYYWDVASPSLEPQQLSLTGVEGGVFTLSDLTVVGNHIFASNMVFAGGDFKVYHWAATSAEPVVLLNYAAAPARLGDAFSVIGDPATSAKLIVSGHGTQDFYVWNIENGQILNTVPTVHTFGTILNASFGRVTKVPGEDMYLASGSGFGLLLLDAQMNVLAEVQAGFFPYWSMYPHIFYYEGHRYLIYSHVKTAPNENILYVLDLNDGATLVEALQNLEASVFADKVVHSINLGDISNGNASVSVDVLNDASGNLMYLAYSAGNGFIAQQVGDASPALLEPITTIIDKSQATGNLPPFISNPGNNRGSGFNGSHAFVASRQDGNHVHYWDVANPEAPAQELNLTGVEGGIFTLSDLTVVGNHIFASNMVFAGGDFKVYHWSGLDAQPTVLLNYPAAPARLGDAFTVLGDPATSAKLIASGHGTQSYYVWNIENGQISNTVPMVYTYENTLNANFGRVTKVPGEDLYLASSSGAGLLLLNSEMVLQAQTQAGYFPYWSMYPQIFYFENHRYLAYIHVKDAPGENMLYILDINDGANALEAIQNFETTPFADRVIHSVNIGNLANGNASVGLDILNDAAGNVLMMAYAAGNGFVAQKIGDEVNVGFFERNTASFNLFPNPANTSFNVSSESMIKSVIIYDVTGKVCREISGNDYQVNIDTDGLSNGLFLVRVKTDNGISSRKLLIQK